MVKQKWEETGIIQEMFSISLSNHIWYVLIVEDNSRKNIFLKLLHKLVTLVFMTAYSLLRFSPNGRDIFLLVGTQLKKEGKKIHAPRK